jgi:hypothetical protein
LLLVLSLLLLLLMLMLLQLFLLLVRFVEGLGRRPFGFGGFLFAFRLACRRSSGTRQTIRQAGKE